MHKLSASGAWEDTTRFLKAHGGLVVAVALAFMALPSILAAPWLGAWQATLIAGGELSRDELLAAVPLFVVLLLVSLVGTLAIYTLALRPGVSVGEALRHGLARLLPSIGITVLIGLVFAVFGFLYVILAVASGPAIGALLVLLIIPVVIYLFVRIYLAQVAVVDGRGPVDALKTSWAMTRGNAGRLVVLLLVSFVVAAVVYLAGTFIVAGLLAALGTALGGLALGQFLAAVVSNILSALITTVLLVLVTMVYRQLSGATAGA